MLELIQENSALFKDKFEMLNFIQEQIDIYKNNKTYEIILSINPKTKEITTFIYKNKSIWSLNTYFSMN
jgi:hypothetical protein